MTTKRRIDNRAIQIAIDRLVREIKLKKNITSADYLIGYNEAISDFIWDYSRKPLVSAEWEKYMQEQEKRGNISRVSIPIDKIRFIEETKE